MVVEAVVKTLTSSTARRVYKVIAVGGVKMAVTTACEVGAYFAGNEIIKKITKKTNYEPVEPCTIKIIKETQTAEA